MANVDTSGHKSRLKEYQCVMLNNLLILNATFMIYFHFSNIRQIKNHNFTDLIKSYLTLLKKKISSTNP